ncbi:MOSC domain-containing protein [Paenibacillus athensensis]|uniref:MOSC domain-containing protein n=1 Tax=Paenibacillus athensensis TaxID=1967502 RepID=A0A4Y8PXG7_9BACL|nr:MOSC domain-containing protein [Paenibacillus athensensis]MCD1259941.1 MOSC domain-containing protein [Paenibacillus athensensis]
MGVEVAAINTGMPHAMLYQSKELVTGIVKTPVSSSLYLSKTQLEGDGQADRVHHGGEDKALCVYCQEHYGYWEQLLERKLGHGAFGENVTVRGLLETEVCIGDIFRLGEAVVQVSQPRQPCFKLAARYGVADLVQRVQDSGFTGYYFRVLEEGVLPARPELRLLERDAGGVTVAFANRIKYTDKGDREGIERIVGVAALSASWRESFVKRLEELPL